MYTVQYSVTSVIRWKLYKFCSETIAEDTTQLEESEYIEEDEDEGEDEDKDKEMKMIKTLKLLEQSLTRMEEKNTELELALSDRLDAIDRLIHDKKDLKVNSRIFYFCTLLLFVI